MPFAPGTAGAPTVIEAAGPNRPIAEVGVLREFLERALNIGSWE
jgi:hypothetical protein